MKRLMLPVCMSLSLLTGCGATEDPAESLIKWKIEGRFDPRHITDQGTTYNLDSPDQENFRIRKVSAQGSVEWSKSYSLINGYAERGVPTVTLQQGADGRQRLVLVSSGYNYATDTTPGNTDFHILVLNEQGVITNEILTVGETFPDGYYHYSVDTEIPGLIIRFKDHSLELVSEGGVIPVEMPATLDRYLIDNVRYTDDAVMVLLRSESRGSFDNKVAYVSLEGKVLWTQDIESVSSSFNDSMFYSRVAGNGVCEYRLQPFDATGFLTPKVIPCSEQEAGSYAFTEPRDGKLHFSNEYEGLTYVRRDIESGEIEAQYENLIDTSGAYVSSINGYPTYHINDIGQVVLPYLVTTDHGGVDQVLNAGLHVSYRSGVVVLNADMSTFAEIEFPEYHVYTWLLRCYSWCADNGDERSGYQITGAKVVDGEIYVTLRYMDYDHISGTAVYRYYLAALN